jgi:hypothetical protein
MAIIYSKYNSNVSAGGGSGTEARFVLQWNYGEAKLLPRLKNDKLIKV